jgi:hypothetical protein
MKLRQIFWQKGSLYDLEINPDECVKIASEFAVNFSIWKDKNCFLVFNSEEFFYYRDSEKYDNAYSTKELVEIYKKENGL